LTAWEFFISSYDSCGGAGKSSNCTKLLALTEFAGELNHNKHGKFMLRLRGTKFPRQQCRILSLTGPDETTSGCFSAVPA